MIKLAYEIINVQGQIETVWARVIAQWMHAADPGQTGVQFLVSPMVS